jgi:hypothetical protein
MISRSYHLISEPLFDFSRFRVDTRRMSKRLVPEIWLWSGLTTVGRVRAAPKQGRRPVVGDATKTGNQQTKQTSRNEAPHNRSLETTTFLAFDLPNSMRNISKIEWRVQVKSHWQISVFLRKVGAVQPNC